MHVLGRVHVVQICSCKDGFSRKVSCLILRDAESQEGVFERVGIFYTSPEEIARCGAERRVVSIV